MTTRRPDPSPNAIHPMLARQLRHLGLTPEHPPVDLAAWQAALERVGRAYDEYDQLVYLVTRAERMSTDELQRSQSALAEAERIAGLGSWTWHVGDEMMQISATMASLLNLPVDTRELAVVVCLACIDPADRALLHDSLRRAATQEVSLCGELRLLPNAVRDTCWLQYRIASRRDPTRPDAMRISGTMLDITERMRAEEQVRTLAFQDSLTGLSNRARFFDLLGAAHQRSNGNGNGNLADQMALLFLDLDGFKAINDRHGHHIGDLLLREVAERLRATVRTSDHLCRFGGDEFLILIDPFNEEMQLERLARQILATIAEPFEIDGQRMSVGVSIGIATYPRDAPNTLALIRAADTAMYQAKQRGKGCFEFHRECTH